MAISDTQKVDLLFKKIGYGVAKTDVATSKSPANETVSSPLLLRGENLWTQSDSISNVGTLPSSNVLVSGSTTVAIYRDSLSSSVQTTNDATAGTNRTWKTGLTNWIGPEFGSGYAVKVYTGASLTAATASSGTSLPVDGSGNNDSWYFDYQSGVLNFADTNVPSSIAAQVWVVGARYTGAVGIATLPALTVTGNISSTNGNVVLTNGSMYATNYYGTFQGTIGGGTSISQSNVASYAAITNLTNNQTYYLEFANVTAGNSVTGAVSTVNVNPSTSTISALAFAGGSGAFTTLSAAGVTQITNGTNATSTATGALQVSGGAGIAGNLYVGGITVISGNVTIGGNLTVSGNSVSIGASTLSITDPIINLNTPTDLTPLTSPTTSDIGIKMHYYDTVDSAAFLGRATDTGYLEWYSRGTDTANVFVGTVYGTIKPGALVLANAKVLGGGLTANTGALQVWGDGSVNGNLYVGGIFTTGSINATPIGNATASTGNFTTLNATSGLTASTVQAATIGNAGANAQLGFITATTLNAATIGNASAAHVGSTVTLTGLVTAATVNAATIGNASAVLAGATATLTGLVTAATVNAATIGNTGAALTGATLSTSSTITASGNIVAQSGTASTTTTTGALVVNGGAGITGALNIGGNETISGNLAVDGGQVTLYDSIIDLHTYGNLAAWATDDGKDIGVRMHYYNGADKLAFFGLENSSKTLQFIIDATEVAGNVTGTYGNLQTGSVVVSNTTAATGTTIGTAGALYVAGGAGIAGALYAGSIQNTPIGSTTASTGNFTTLNATTSLTTATVNAATIGNASASHVGSTVTITGLVTAATVNAATIGNASAVLAGATATLTGLVTAATVNAATIGNTGATFSGSTGTFVGNISAGNLTTSGSNGNISGVNTVFATLFSGSGASLTNLPASQVAGTVTTANVSMYDNFTNTSTNATFYPSFFDKLTGNGSQFTSSTLSYNPSTGALTATSFNGVGTFSTATTSSTFISGGNVVITSGVDAVSPTTGALLLTGSGGASVGGNLYVAKDLYVGAGAFNTTLTTPTIFAVDQGSSYAQGAILNSSNTGSADWIAYGNNYPGASNDHGWVDIGFTGDAFSDPNYSITKRNDAYLFGSGANATVGGNLVLSTDYTGSFNDIVLGVGSFYANSEVARFHGNTSNSGTFIIKLPTNASPAANTGALQVWGGASFSSNVYHGGGTILNGSKTAGFDTIVKGNRDDTLIWARPNATYDAVILGNSATAATVVNGAKLQINTSDSILLPVGTNAQRPSASGLGTDTAGMLRYSTTAGSIEWYNGSAWTGASSSFTVIADEQFNGTGSQTIFTLSTSQTTNSCIVSINGVVQIPTLAYAVTSGTTLTFTEAPASGDVIDVRKLTTTQTVTGITSTNGYMQFAVDNYGAYVYTGTASTAATTFWSNTGAEVNAVGNVTTSSIGDATLDSFFANTYSSAEYTVTATLSGTTVREMAKILIVHNGTTASRVVYGVVSTAGNALVSYSANIVNGSATLYGTPTNANTVLRIRKNYQAI